MGTPAVEVSLPDVPMPISGSTRYRAATYSRRSRSTSIRARQAAPAGATIAVSVGLPSPYAATESFLIYSIGTWSTHQVVMAEVPAVAATTLAFTTPYDAAHFNTVSGRALEKITADDIFLALRYVGSDLTGVFEAVPFTQTGTTW